MSDETRTQVLGCALALNGYKDARVSGQQDFRDQLRAALTAHEQAVAAEAVLAFAEWLVTAIGARGSFEPEAREFVEAQGWTLPAAERTKP